MAFGIRRKGIEKDVAYRKIQDVASEKFPALQRSFGEKVRPEDEKIAGGSSRGEGQNKLGSDRDPAGGGIHGRLP